MLTRIGLVTSLVMALALASCGRRGPLESPPGAAPPPPKPAAQTSAVRPEPDAPVGLFRNTSNVADTPGGGQATPEKKPQRSTPFVLDPLL